MPGQFKACTLKLYPHADNYKKSAAKDVNLNFIFVPSTCDTIISPSNKPLVTGTDKTGIACVEDDPNVA